MARFLLLMIVSAVSLCSSGLNAQMFSVGETQSRPTYPTSFFRVGLGPTSFSYTGNDINPQGPELLELNSSALYLNIETPGVNLSLILANKITGLKDVTLVDLGFTLSNKFTFIRTPFLTGGLPIQLYSSLTNVNNEKTEESFNQVNFALGGGGFMNIRFSEKISFTNEFTPGYGFSNSSGGFFGGGMFYMTGKSRLNLINVLGGRSLSFGYDFNYRTFDIEGELYDFDLKSHLLTIGISL